MNIQQSVLVGLALLFIIPLQTVGQRNFVEGYIVSQNQDTTYGYIDYREWTKTPSHINFKESEEAGSKRYYPEDLTSFRVNDAYYLSRKIRIDTTPRDIDELKTEPTSRLDTLFLRVLVKGNASLLYHQDKAEHFFILNNGVLTNLIYQVLKGSREDQSMALYNEQYQTQLKSEFSNCPADFNTDNLKYKLRPMIRLFEAYNNCVASGSQYVVKQSKPTLEFRILGGATMGELFYTRNYVSTVKYDKSFSFVFGGALSLVLPGNLNKWSIGSEVLLHPAKYERVLRSDANNSIRTYSLGGTYVELNILARYQLPWNKVKPFLNIGLSNGFALTKKNKGVLSYETNSLELERPLFGNFRRYEMGGMGGIGARAGKLSFEVRYEISDGMAEWKLPAETTTVNNFFVIVGYQL